MGEKGGGVGTGRRRKGGERGSRWLKGGVGGRVGQRGEEDEEG